ncbi:hypothetical protein SCOR_30565 [Sulfidibacter corallicola]|uniref:Uncharacterized protein n=1 Tax=Sulfidibacter corallicola TaxID=2818388 RepID=A0A8A4TJ96_SULCO|nr:hypothetical protein [Sulfidibacter corallicola]QTD50099.1 hypothetical protein J3U87_31330 [Sulfidibacter corallicola]
MRPPTETTFDVLNQNSVDNDWNGIGTVLAKDQSVNMPQTPNGTVIFAYANQATRNNQGQLAISSGGSEPLFPTVPFGANQPSILMNNWHANNLSVTNISAADDTPIWIAAYGPGIPGQFPLPLSVGATLPLSTTQSAQGNALPQFMQLAMRSQSSDLTIFGLIGGPTDEQGDNGHVFALNASENTGPGTGNPPPDGYTATTTGNNYAYQFNWGSSTVYVVNLSPVAPAQATVTLTKL